MVGAEQAMTLTIGCWQDPPLEFVLSARQLDLWRVSFAELSGNLATAQDYLSSDELTRAKKFLAADKKREFVLARASLRKILSSYLQINPRDIEFSYTAQGKPGLQSPERQLHFNLAHSGDWAVVAVSAAGPLGVDVEKIETRLDCLDLADRFFNPHEAECLHALGEIRRCRTFYRLWTQKECYLKRDGQGISGGLERLDHAAARIQQFPLAKRYLGAVCLPESVSAIKRYQLSSLESLSA
jgi:4'-phosphopantetheinyl transferase